MHLPGHEVQPQAKQESIFRPVYAEWLRLEVYLDAILRATTKKKSSTFSGKKVHPRQNPGYAYVARRLRRVDSLNGPSDSRDVPNCTELNVRQEHLENSDLRQGESDQNRLIKFSVDFYVQIFTIKYSCKICWSVFSTDLHIYNLDAISPILVVSNHVDIDKLTTANGGTFTSSSASRSSQSR